MSKMTAGNPSAESIHSTIQLRRSLHNPIIQAGMVGFSGVGVSGKPASNINGPCLIRVPDWIENPLGKYYLYFAHHQGRSIQLAYADCVEGPWRIYAPGTLQLDQTCCVDHIASPDVHVDHSTQTIRLYFHGVYPGQGQVTMLATSADGIYFTAASDILGPFYFRVFQHDGWYYAIAKNHNRGGVLLRSADGISPFERGPDIIPQLRHAAVWIEGNQLMVFYSRIGDTPERILVSCIELVSDWHNWQVSEPIELLAPEMDYEGASLSLIPSVPGGAWSPARQLRDPAIYVENERSYLLYSVAGEQGIAIAQFNLESLLTQMKSMSSETISNSPVSDTSSSSLWQTIRSGVKRHRAPAIASVSRDRHLPLSFAQERLWQLHQLAPTNTAHHIQLVRHLQGELNLSALEQSLHEITQRHEILRTTLTLIDGRPAQVISTHQEIPLDIVDLQHLPDAERKVIVEQQIRASREEPFDLSSGPLWRVKLLRLANHEHVFIRCVHHIIYDGWSGSIFGQEFTALYSAFNAGRPSPLPPLPIQYADFANWQRQTLNDEGLSSLQQYWQQQLKSPIAPLKLPYDHPRPSIPTNSGARQSLKLSTDLTYALKQISHQEGISLFVTLLAAFKALLFCYTQQTDLLVCTPVANRQHPEIKKLIGYFNNVLPLRTDLSGNPNGRELRQRVGQVVLEAQDHQDMPLQAIAEFPHLARIPFNRAMFALQNTPTRSFELPGIEITGWTTKSTVENTTGSIVADFDLSLSMQEKRGQLVGTLVYKTDLFTAAAITQLLDHFRELLECWVVDPEKALENLPTFQVAIELGEIESVLAHHPQVKEVAVITRDNQPDKKYLVAYIVPTQHQVPTPDELRQFLKQKLPNYMIPAAFVLLDTLPLTVNGKIDRKYLESLSSTPLPTTQMNDVPIWLLPGLERSLFGPKNLTQEMLAQLWGEVLDLRSSEKGKTPLNIFANFFELGGHSLAASRLIYRIEDVFQIRLSLQHLFENPTIFELSTYLETEQKQDLQSLHQSSSHLVPLQTGGSRLPLFWVAGGAGDENTLMYYAKLVFLLGQKQPVYGLCNFKNQGGGWLNQQEWHPTVEALAADYVSAIRTVQPEGPYLISGECIGGVVAFEVAQQLLAQGQTVERLILVDAKSPNANSSLELALQNAPSAEAISHAIDQALAQNNRGLFNQTAFSHQKAIIAAYQPQPYAGSITLIVTQESYSRSSTTGWEPLALGGLESYIVPGDHESYMGQFVQTTAMQLRTCLNAIHAKAKLGETPQLPLITQVLSPPESSSMTSEDLWLNCSSDERLERLLQRGLQIEPQQAEFHRYLGYIWSRQGEWEAVITCAQQVIDLQPTWSIGYQMKGNAFRSLKRWNEALPYFQTAIQLKPHAGIYIELGQTQQQLGLIEDAIASCQQAIVLSPDNPYAYSVLAYVQKHQGALEAAILNYQKAIEHNHQNPAEIHKNLGDCFRQLGKTAEAIAAYEQSCLLKSDNAGLYRLLGDLQFQVGAVEKTIANYQKAIELEPNQPISVYKRLGDFLYETGEIESAILVYQEILNLYPQDQAIRRKLYSLTAQSPSLENEID